MDHMLLEMAPKGHILHPWYSAGMKFKFIWIQQDSQFSDNTLVDRTYNRSTVDLTNLYLSVEINFIDSALIRNLESSLVCKLVYQQIEMNEDLEEANRRNQK